jgi:hypothetical protein
MKTHRITKHQRVTEGPGGFSAVIICGLIGAMLFVTEAQAASTITSKVDVTPPTTQLSSDEWRAVSLSAGRILMHASQALDALADKRNDEAAANIDKGLTLVKILEGILPPTIVKTEIAGAGQTYQDQDSVKLTFVPIYREYDQVDVITPVIAQKQQAATTPPAKSGTAPQFTYTGLDYTGIKLNLPLAKRDLLLAQDFVKQGNVMAATAALQDILVTGVIFEFSTMREPLVRAMDNLRLAESELKNKHPEQAKAALVGAQDALKNYGKLAGDSRSKEVAELNKEVDEVAKKLSAEKEESFSTKISHWWDKILNWYNK